MIRLYPQHILLTTATFFLLACNNTPSNIPDGFYYHHIYFGRSLTTMRKEGIKDGCETARGFYTKSHWNFNNRPEYYKGWFLGRKKCRHLLRIDDNGDLIR